MANTQILRVFENEKKGYTFSKCRWSRTFAAMRLLCSRQNKLTRGWNKKKGNVVRSYTKSKLQRQSKRFKTSSSCSKTQKNHFWSFCEFRAFRRADPMTNRKNRKAQRFTQRENKISSVKPSTFISVKNMINPQRKIMYKTRTVTLPMHPSSVQTTFITLICKKRIYFAVLKSFFKWSNWSFNMSHKLSY